MIIISEEIANEHNTPRMKRVKASGAFLSQKEEKRQTGIATNV